MPTETNLETTDLSPELYESILQQVEDGSCILFLGPGAIMAKQTDGSFRPVTELCANFLVQKYGLTLAPQEAESLSFVTSLLLNRSHGRIADIILRGEVQKFYEQMGRTIQLPPMLEHLADLPFRIIVNTTHDNYFAELYESAGVPKRFAYYNFEKPDPKDPLYTFDAGAAPLIYNLLGFYGEKPQSMVLSYSDQLNFINKITGQQNEAPPNSLLKALDKPVFHLFMGFDFNDWSLRVLFNAIFRNERKNMQPFAYRFKTDEDAGVQAKVFFQGEFDMVFPTADMETFVTELIATRERQKGQTAGDAGKMRAEILVLHNEAKDEEGFAALSQYLKPLKVQVSSLKDALGAGDMQAWVREAYQRCQVVLPLVTIDFFDDSNPALPLLDEIVKANNPRNNDQRKLLVLPLLLKTINVKDTPFAALRTIHPSDGNAVYGNGAEDKQFSEVTDTLKRYIDKLSTT